MFCQKSDSALSSSCYRADLRGTRVWTCSQLNSWASIKRRERGHLIEGGALNRGRVLIRENTVPTVKHRMVEPLAAWQGMVSLTKQI